MNADMLARRSEQLAAVAALLLLFCLFVGLLASCGGNDLAVGGTGVVTATETALATETP